MKRYILIFSLIVLITFSCCACGNKENVNENTTPPESTVVEDDKTTIVDKDKILFNDEHTLISIEKIEVHPTEEIALAITLSAQNVGVKTHANVVVEQVIVDTQQVLCNAGIRLTNNKARTFVVELYAEDFDSSGFETIDDISYLGFTFDIEHADYETPLREYVLYCPNKGGNISISQYQYELQETDTVIYEDDNYVFICRGSRSSKIFAYVELYLINKTDSRVNLGFKNCYFNESYFFDNQKALTLEPYACCKYTLSMMYEKTFYIPETFKCDIAKIYLDDHEIIEILGQINVDFREDVSENPDLENNESTDTQ